MINLRSMSCASTGLSVIGIIVKVFCRSRCPPISESTAPRTSAARGPDSASAVFTTLVAKADSVRTARV